MPSILASAAPLFHPLNSKPPLQTIIFLGCLDYTILPSTTFETGPPKNGLRLTFQTKGLTSQVFIFVKICLQYCSTFSAFAVFRYRSWSCHVESSAPECSISDYLALLLRFRFPWSICHPSYVIPLWLRCTVMPWFLQLASLIRRLW